MIVLNSSIDPTNQYRLLELSPRLLKAVETNSHLQIKSSHNSGDVTLCTESKTFKLRQINQSNTLLIVNGEEVEDNAVTAFGTASSFLEGQEIIGSIDLTTVPVYRGDGEITKTESSIEETVESLRSRSPASNEEFEALWTQNIGVEVKGVACLLDNQMTSTILTDILLTAVSKKMSLNNVDRDLIVSQSSIEEDRPVIEQVFRRFTSLGHDETTIAYMFEAKAISHWYGLQVLRENAKSTNLNIMEFLDRWKQAIPVNLGVELNIDDLVGHYVVPNPDTIRYFTSSILSDKPKTRFHQLFTIKSSWDFEEIVPFIEDIRNKSVKMESFIMKFARKKTVGKKVIVTAR
jgi:sister chromatid cohesion protein DCC1